MPLAAAAGGGGGGGGVLCALGRREEVVVVVVVASVAVVPVIVAVFLGMTVSVLFPSSWLLPRSRSIFVHVKYVNFQGCQYASQLSGALRDLVAQVQGLADVRLLASCRSAGLRWSNCCRHSTNEAIGTSFIVFRDVCCLALVQGKQFHTIMAPVGLAAALSSK